MPGLACFKCQRPLRAAAGWVDVPGVANRRAPLGPGCARRRKGPVFVAEVGMTLRVWAKRGARRKADPTRQRDWVREGVTA